MKKEDFDQVFELLKQLYYKDKLSKVKTKRIFLNTLADKDAIQVSIKEKKIIGYAAVKIRADVQSQGKIGHLTELIIDKDYRGQGLGTKLLKRIIKQSKTKGCKEIQFPSTFKRKKAHRFYKKIGFNKTAYFFWKEI